MATKWERKSFRFAMRFVFIFGGIVIANIIMQLIPGGRMVSQWGIIFQLPLLIFLFILPSKIWSGRWTKKTKRHTRDQQQSWQNW